MMLRIRVIAHGIQHVAVYLVERGYPVGKGVQFPFVSNIFITGSTKAFHESFKSPLYSGCRFNLLVGSLELEFISSI